MPIYDYKCTKCGHRFEKIQKLSDAPVKKCPECGGKVEKLLTAPAVHFKGSGFYITDYANKNSTDSKSKSSEGASTSSTDSSETKSSSSSETSAKEEPSSKKPGKK